jgi:hypothetical protein
VQGLYPIEFGERQPDNARITSIFLHTPEQFRIAQRLAQGFKAGSLGWPNVFEYRVGRAKDAPNSSGWLLRFFDSVTYLIAVLRPADDPRGV